MAHHSPLLDRRYQAVMANHVSIRSRFGTFTSTANVFTLLHSAADSKGLRQMPLGRKPNSLVNQSAKAPQATVNAPKRCTGWASSRGEPPHRGTNLIMDRSHPCLYGLTRPTTPSRRDYRRRPSAVLLHDPRGDLTTLVRVSGTSCGRIDSDWRPMPRLSEEIIISPRVQP